MEFTPEQKKKLLELERSSSIRSVLIGVIGCAILLAANGVCTLIDYFYVHNVAFCFVTAACNAFFVLGTMRSKNLAERDRVIQETKKILSKEE